jgi:hypothetical protein
LQAGINVYLYCQARPVTLNDPNGLDVPVYADDTPELLGRLPLVGNVYTDPNARWRAGPGGLYLSQGTMEDVRNHYERDLVNYELTGDSWHLRQIIKDIESGFLRPQDVQFLVNHAGKDIREDHEWWTFVMIMFAVASSPYSSGKSPRVRISPTQVVEDGVVRFDPLPEAGKAQEPAPKGRTPPPAGAPAPEAAGGKPPAATVEAPPAPKPLVPEGARNASRPNLYAVSDAADPSFKVNADVNEGVLSLNMRTQRLEPVEGGAEGPPQLVRSSSLRGKEQYEAVVKYFEGKFTKIEGHWEAGPLDANLAEFNRLTGLGVSPQQAARQTWSGIQAKEAGYTHVEVKDLQGTPGHYSKVRVHFSKPPQ